MKEDLPYHKLPAIAARRGEPLEQLIPRLLDELGTPFKVAVELGVYPVSIRHWLKRNGYASVDGKWRRIEKGEAEHA
jgi:hypothetical protein